MDQVVDRAIEREHALMEMLANRTPVVETYLQNLTADASLGPVPSEDHYFLGRMDMGENIDRKDYLKDQKRSMQQRLMGGFQKLYKVQYKPMGFSWMVYADRTDFDREHYKFHYARREFLGDVRCLIFDVISKERCWQGPLPWPNLGGRPGLQHRAPERHLRSTPRNAYFFHMDSWRLNLIPGYWVPAYIYSEEGDFGYRSKDENTFKAQTRLWGYDLQKGAQNSELTKVLVDSTVKDESPADAGCFSAASAVAWQQQAGDNVIERLHNAGLLAPAGEVDKVLETVVNNLLTSNNIELPGPVHARVMLTSPLETFSAGNTIVIAAAS